MNRTTALRRLERSAISRLRRLRLLAARSSKMLPEEREPLAAFLTIELQSTWANFAKAFFRSWIIGTKGGTGRRITTTPTGMSETTAVRIALKAVHPKMSESRASRDGSRALSWHDPNTLIRSAAGLATSNSDQVAEAFSQNQRVFKNLPVARNYFAHRNEVTEGKVKDMAFTSYGIPTTRRPSEAVLSPMFSNLQPLIETWIEEVSDTIRYLCE